MTRLREGERLPWHLGIVYFDHSRLEVVCWPIGLHLLARLVYDIWLATCCNYSKSRWQQMLRKASSSGFNEGRKIGRLEGADMRSDEISQFFVKELRRDRESV